MIIWNRDSDSQSYDEFMSKPRPGHADYTGYMKYGGFNDFRGSGRFSGRLSDNCDGRGSCLENIKRNL